MRAKIAETGNKACSIWRSNISKVSSVTYPDFLYEKKNTLFRIRYETFKKNYLVDFFFQLPTALF